jgi:ATP-dependent exoDNAse (exonuclease V) beta subunit
VKPPTPSQWEAIRTVDRHVLVAAGAGTGKTTTVVGRILYLLGVEIEGARCPVRLTLRDIGAITYTNAAAADLKKKLRQELRDIGLRDVAYEVDAARIGTIHSFCGDILREFALRSGRSPGLKVLEEGEASALIAEVVHDTLLRVLEAGTGLHELFAVWSVAEVEGWLRRLVGENARLDRIAAERVALGAHERTVLDLAVAARDEIGRRLHALGAVDFDRMIVWTRDLLRADPMVRRALQRRLKVLIVDEFQDVDPVQKEIAYLLGDPESGRADTTRLMLVGDPKQSIYRFRRADVTVWRAVQDDFERRKLGAVVPLADNFRSLEPILAFVDATVGRILDRPIAGDTLRDYEVPFQPVAATRFGADGEPAVELLFVVPERGEKLKADEIRAAEADAVARRAWELRHAGVEWRDMAMVLASWSSLDVYESALRRTGIPTYALRTEGFFERREILDLTLALETLRDPRDDRALIGFLRSPFVGLKDETLLRIATARLPGTRRAAPPYWDHLHEIEIQLEAEERALYAWALELLREHVALRDRIPADRLLERLLERSGYLAHLYAFGPEGDQAIANVRKFLRLARQSPEHGVGEAAGTRKAGAWEGDARLYGAG